MNKNIKLIIELMAFVLILSLCACGKTEEDYYYEEDNYSQEEEIEFTMPDEEYINITPEVLLITDLADDSLIPSNFMEERVGKVAFESQQDIISSLESGEGYAYISLKGATEKVLVISNDIFDMGEKKCSTTVYPYIKNEEGMYVCGSVFVTDSNATPIAVSGDGLVYCATQDTIEKMCLSSDTNGIMDMVYLYMDIASEETSYGGFIREENVCAKPGIEIDRNDSSYYETAFEEYKECEAVDFTVVE